MAHCFHGLLGAVYAVPWIVENQAVLQVLLPEAFRWVAFDLRYASSCGFGNGSAAGAENSGVEVAALLILESSYLTHSDVLLM